MLREQLLLCGRIVALKAAARLYPEHPRAEHGISCSVSFWAGGTPDHGKRESGMTDSTIDELEFMSTLWDSDGAYLLLGLR